MRNLLCIMPNPDDTTAFYRSSGVLGHLRKIMDINPVFAHEINWRTVGLVDGVFMQRPFSADHLKAAEIIKKNKAPLILDYDDNLFDVPKNNPSFKVYGSPHVHGNMMKIMSAADVIIVSTEALADRLGQFRPKCVVIPNALHDQKHPLDEVPLPRRKIVTWRGSLTHAKDLELLHPVLNKETWREAWQMVFVGDPDFKTVELAEAINGRHVPTDDINNYMQNMKSLAPAIHVVPLEDNSFNRCKSNIAWIEATYAGAVCIAPDWPEWQKPGIINYKKGELEQKLFDAIDGLFPIEDMVLASRQAIPLLSEVNKLRLELFNKYL